MKQVLKPLRTAVIGVGSMGRNHARVLADLNGSELVGIVDSNTTIGAEVAAATGAAPLSSVEEAIALGLDAAVVAVPTANHYAVVSQLLEAGVHVLVEKPIAARREEAQELIRLAEASKRILTVGHIERFNPAVRTLAETLGDEAIISITISRVGPFPPRINDVGIVIDLGVHDIDLIRWLGRSEIVEQQALFTRTRGEHEDIALLQFQLENGTLAQLNINWLTPFKERKISVSTAKRFIVCDMLLRTVSEYSGFSTDLGAVGPGSGGYVSRSLNVPFGEPLRGELEAFLAAVRGDSEISVTGFDGLRSLEVALSCLSEADRPS